MGDRIRLRDVRTIFRLIGEVREMGADPARWRPHMVRRLQRLLGAAVVVSTEVYLRPLRPGGQAKPGMMRIIDIGWGCAGNKGEQVWQIQNECEGMPESYLIEPLAVAAEPDSEASVPVRPTVPLREGKSFLLSQYPLPHLGAVDQLGVHHSFGRKPFTAVQQRLLRLFHVELGRLWKKDALKLARDPASDLPPRLAQTLAALQTGSSEKQISNQLGISPHTVHNYVKALHQRLGVSSRGELLAKAPRPDAFLPKLSMDVP